MANDDRYRSRRWRDDDDRRGEDEGRFERHQGYRGGDIGRYAASDRGRDERWRDDRGRDEDDRFDRGRRDELRSVGSPGVGGGSRGDEIGRAAWDRDRGGAEPRYTRPGRGAYGGYGAGGYGRDEERERELMRTGGRAWDEGRGRQGFDRGGRGTMYGMHMERGLDERERRGRGYAEEWEGRRSARDRDEDEGEGGWSPYQEGRRDEERTGRGIRSMGGFGLDAGQAGRGWRGRNLGRGGGFHGKGPIGYTRSDQRIFEDACDLLTEDHEVDASNIEVKVDKGEVTLTGTVEERAMKRRAEELIEDVPGVKDVHNQLRVARKGEREEEARPNGNRAAGTTSANDRRTPQA